MPVRKTPRLAYCEYVIADCNHSTAAWMARLELMGSVQRVYATMLKRLSVNVFPAYAELAQSGYEFDGVLWHPRLSPHTTIPESRLKSALFKWAREFHAETGWFLDEVLRTLRGWYVAPDWRDKLKWNPIGGITNTLAMGEPFQFNWEGWEMQVLTWANYSRSVREAFELKLAEYEAACRTLAESRGLVHAPRKYSPANLDWFVLYQFEGLSSTKIVKRVARANPNIDESTVLKGVKTAARLIGWEGLRASRPTASIPNRKIR